MTKTNIITNPALQPNSANPIGFNLVTQTNSFNSFFSIKPLESFEVNKIQQLLSENSLPEMISEAQVSKDIEQIKQITAEIKAIAKQGVVLLGERIFKVREVLKPYRNGTFTKWLEATFGSRKTAYNIVAYYELYSTLPNPELKEYFKKIPQKAAYVLASREGDIGKKIEIINQCHHLSTEEIIAYIQDKLPIFSRAKKMINNASSKLIFISYEALKKLQKHKHVLSLEHKTELMKLKGIIDNILT